MVGIAFASLAARAEVSGIEVASRPDVVADESFDDVGGYAEDQPAIVARAMARWDGLTQGTPLAGR
jgi:hypothetical protein